MRYELHIIPLSLQFLQIWLLVVFCLRDFLNIVEFINLSMASGFLSYLLRPLLFQEYKNILLQLTGSISKFKSLIHLKFIWCKVQTRDLTFFPRWLYSYLRPDYWKIFFIWTEMPPLLYTKPLRIFGSNSELTVCTMDPFIHASTVTALLYLM